MLPKTAMTDFPPPGPEFSQRPPSILIAEDNPLVQQVLLASFERAGFRCTLVSDGREAMEALVRTPEPFDLILTDHEMPRGSGVEVVAQLRAGSWRSRVVVFSGSLPSALLRQYSVLRVDRIVAKPCRMSELIEIVREVLRTRDDEAAAL